MKKYEVTVPITGCCVVDVEAESEKEAIEIAIGEVSPENLETWQAHEKIVAGNVFYGDINEAFAEEVSDE